MKEDGSEMDNVATKATVASSSRKKTESRYHTKRKQVVPLFHVFIKTRNNFLQKLGPDLHAVSFALAISSGIQRRINRLDLALATEKTTQQR